MPEMKVFLTVDTEHSIGGAFRDPKLKPVGNEKRIFGKIGNKNFGIPLIIDIANHYGFPVTFFVEVLNRHYFGGNETGEVCEYILKRGHDIQLHLHPNYLNFMTPDPSKKLFSDVIGSYSLAKQIEILAEGVEIFAQIRGVKPIAFRAGGFGANQETLRALKENGLFIDCSYNRAYLGKSCFLKDSGINDLAHIDGIWEFPVTNFIESIKLRAKRFMPLDINGVSFEEMRYVLNGGRSEGPRNIVVLLHSFSFIKPYDVQYEKVRPRFEVIKRFEKLCQFLNMHPEVYQVRTFGSLSKEDLSRMSMESVHKFPHVPNLLSLIRGFQQLKDRWF